ncbi:MAG: type II toxin-antitoxin system VapC family toxin [Chloroflexi bacterium]|nr:type II toxin-antitoxin system VapC family toxin [Chloroflexota bacterium]
MIVVDTNVLAYAVLPGERTDAALSVVRRDPEWVAPRLWRSELRNVLATAMRAGHLKLDLALTAFRAAEELVQDVEVETSTEGCLRVAIRGAVSAYDAEFVIVAEQMGLMLVTGDRRLVRAFPRSAVFVEDFATGAL